MPSEGQVSEFLSRFTYKQFIGLFYSNFKQFMYDLKGVVSPVLSVDSTDIQLGFELANPQIH